MNKPLICFALLLTLVAPAAMAQKAPDSTPKAASPSVIPAKAGIQKAKENPPDVLDSRLRGNDERVEKAMKSLSLRERVAQLMLVTFEGLRGPSNGDRSLLKNSVPGGVVIPLMESPGQAADYIKALRANTVETRKHIPLLIGADIYSLTHSDSRFQSTFIQMPSLLSIAAAGDAGATRTLAELIAAHLTMMGFNLSIGPSLTLAPSLPGAAPSLNTLGSSPEFTAEAGGTMLTTLAENGLITMPTGFPGGGANRQAKGLATLSTPREKLPEQDLLPYMRAIELGAPMVHVGNTVAPTLDDASAVLAAQPASLSPAVMRELLRNQLHFKGVIVAGPFDSPDILQLYDAPHAVVLALKAGADMLYWTQGSERVQKCVETIARAVEAGTLDEATVNQAVTRIVQLKLSRELGAREAPIEKKANALETKKKFALQSYDIECRAITLLKNEDGVLPLSKKASMPIGVTGVVGVDEMKDALEKHIKGVVEQPILTAAQVGDIEDFEINRLTADDSGVRTVICVLGGLKRTGGARRLIKAFQQAGARVVVVFLGHPGQVAELADADAIIVAYSDAARSAESIKAIADILVGQPPIRIATSSHDIHVKVGKPQHFDVANVVHAPAGRLPLTLSDQFEAGLAVSYESSVAIKKAFWDFGDNSCSKDSQVEHVFQSPGKFTVKLTVTDHTSHETTGAFTIVAE